jgi:formylglycine-generating enzyme required for sulfatase activity
MMGSSDADLTGARPLHRVTVNPFRMAKTLVTNKQYRACVAAGACSPPHDFDGKCWVRRPGAVAYGGWSLGKLPDSFKGDDQPAVCVDWKQADDFSAWAGGRLPSEAEWEYAARGAGRDQKYPWGDEDPTCARAETKACGKAATAPVCSRPSGDTRQGLCDMAGNAWEFVLDSYHDTYDGAPQDGRAWEFGGTSRVNRGGSWSDDADVVRSAHRGRAPDAGNFTVGFRPAR